MITSSLNNLFEIDYLTQKKVIQINKVAYVSVIIKCQCNLFLFTLSFIQRSTLYK